MKKNIFRYIKLSSIYSILFFSCTSNTISTKEYLSFMSADPGIVNKSLVMKGWHLTDAGIQNTDYLYTYSYFKTDPLHDYISVDKCNDANLVCRIVYGIDSTEFYEIPEELIHNGFELLSKSDKNDAFNVVYVKSKLYDVAANLVKIIHPTYISYCMIITNMKSKTLTDKN